MTFFVFLGIFFLCTFIFGHLLEKIRVPWIFSSLLVGIGLSSYNPFFEFTNSSNFHFMSQLGLYLLLFLIGFELNIKELLKSGKFIVKATFVIEITEMLLVGTALHFLFSTPWMISLIVALSFATVGEAILLPILEELNLVKKDLGQKILGIATFDDIFEILVILSIVFIAPFFIQELKGEFYNPVLINALFILIGLVIFILLVTKKFKKEIELMKIPDIATVLPLLLSVLFIFIGIDSSSGGDIAVLGALFAGVTVKNLLPQQRAEEVEPQIKAITYGLFAPVFFLNIGLDTQVNYLIAHFWLIIFITLIAKFAKILGSYFIGRKEIGTKPSIFMGVALGVRFSTSLVFLKILLDNHIIPNNLYSVLIGTSIFFKFIIPILLSGLAKRWRL